MAKRSGTGKWLLLLVLIAGILVYFNVSDKPSDPDTSKQLYTLNKKGAGTVADYTATARQIHKAVDGVLAKADLAVGSVQETGREVPRQKVEGAIVWHARQLPVTVPADARAEALQQALQAGLKGSGGEVLGPPQPDEYQGQPAIRLDIGLRSSLEGDQLTLITDRIYLIGKRDAAPSPQAGGTGKIAIIIDDFGYSAEPIEAFAAIKKPLTFAVLPYRPYSGEAAGRALGAGHQVMLHLPMEALSAAEHPEPTTINTGMSDQEIQQTVQKAIQAVPGIIGVNNHQGSKATADKRVMKNVLAVLKANSLFFVDSRTNSQSVAYAMSRQMGLRTAENYLFLDNNPDVESVKAQLRAAARAAVQHGSVTVIGHARLNTAAAIREMLPELAANGVTLVFESQLAR